jgi:hypothetical protein
MIRILIVLHPAAKKKKQGTYSLIDAEKNLQQTNCTTYIASEKLGFLKSQYPGRCYYHKL